MDGDGGLVILDADHITLGQTLNTSTHADTFCPITGSDSIFNHPVTGLPVYTCVPFLLIYFNYRGLVYAISILTALILTDYLIGIILKSG